MSGFGKFGSVFFLLDRDPYKTNTVRIRNTAHKVVILCAGKAEDSGGGSEAGAGG